MSPWLTLTCSRGAQTKVDLAHIICSLRVPVLRPVRQRINQLHRPLLKDPSFHQSRMGLQTPLVNLPHIGRPLAIAMDTPHCHTSIPTHMLLATAVLHTYTIMPMTVILLRHKTAQTEILSSWMMRFQGLRTPLKFLVRDTCVSCLTEWVVCLGGTFNQRYSLAFKYFQCLLDFCQWLCLGNV